MIPHEIPDAYGFGSIGFFSADKVKFHFGKHDDSVCQMHAKLLERVSMKKWCGYSVVFLFFSALTALSQTSQQTALQTAPPTYSVGPITDYNAAQPNTGGALRFRRAERYNSPGSPEPELGEESEQL